MVQHIWGEQGVDWEGIENAAYYIGDFLAKWGRINVSQTKEKFGTARVYCHFGWSCFHTIIWPRHMWIHKWWPYRADLHISKYLMPIFNWIAGRWQVKIYRMAYKRALKKWPHLREEILCCADGHELLKDL